jgi:hypothetical protein
MRDFIEAIPVNSTKVDMFQIKSKKAWLLLIVCATLVQSSCGFKPRRNLDALVTIPYYRDSKDDVVSFKLPEGYIDRWVVGGDRFATPQDKLYLHASGVDLKPETEANRKEFEFPASLMNEIRFDLASMYRVASEKRINAKEHFLRSRFNSISSECQFKKELSVIYELHLKALNITPKNKCDPELSEDVYFNESAQKYLKTVIRCSPKEIQESGVEGKAQPRCEHHFYLKEFNVGVQMNYDRAFLPQWQKLEANVKRLLTTSLQTNQPSN